MSDPDTGKQDDNAALIALRDLPSQLRDDAIGHAPRRAERLLAAADEIERLRRELAEVQTKYGLLSSAINESTDECGPDCDDYGHGDKCPSLDPERWLIDQQATIEGLRRELAEAEALLRDAQTYAIDIQDFVLESGYKAAAVECADRIDAYLSRKEQP